MTHLSCNPVTDNTGTSLCRGALGKDRIHLDFTLQVKHGICHSCNPSTLGPTGEELEFKASLDYGTKLLIKNKQTKKKRLRLISRDLKTDLFVPGVNEILAQVGQMAA